MVQRDMSLDFVRTDIGVAILGVLTSQVGTAFLLLAAGDDAAEGYAVVGAIFVLVGGIAAFSSLWHLGWRLAFPRKIRGARAPRASRRDQPPMTAAERRQIALLVGIPLVAVVAVTAIIIAVS
jgi:hypothetical protein